MATTTGTHGNSVQVTMVGVIDTINYLKKKHGQILDAQKVALAKASAYAATEVQESILGNRDEPKSVDTGKFANSITIKENGKQEVEVYPRGVPYSIFLEEGTSAIPPRRHFKNTEIRTAPKIREIVAKEMKKATE